MVWLQSNEPAHTHKRKLLNLVNKKIFAVIDKAIIAFWAHFKENPLILTPNGSICISCHFSNFLKRYLYVPVMPISLKL